MPIKFSGFPQKAATELGRFLDYKSLLRLREISKAVKGFVDVSVHRTLVPLIKIERETMTSGVMLSFELCVSEEYFLWENCFRNVIEALDDVKSFCFDNGEYNLPPALTVVLKIQQLKQFLNCIKFLINGSQSTSIYIDTVPIEIVSIFCEFIKPENVSKVSVDTRKSNSAEFFPWIDLINKFNLHTLDYVSRMLAKDDIKLLLHFAKVSQRIRIRVDDYTYGSVDLLSAVHGILQGKCEFLTLFGNFSGNVFISNGDIESLLKCFHNLNKQVYIITQTDSEPMNLRIGFYEVTVQNHPIPRHVSIRHLIK